MTETYSVAFANAQLVIERVSDRWVVWVCDLNGRETFHRDIRQSLSDATVAAVQFALARIFGPSHRKDAVATAQALTWDPVAQS